MTDLIDRQAILKHIEKIRQGVQMMDDTHRASIIMNGMHLCEEAVRNQPSAQPEVLACGSGELVQESYSLVEDCISRQEAIVAINHICPVDTEYDCTLLDRVDVRCVLSDLPSAEQERRGQWVIRDNPGTGWYRVTCSKCGEDVTNEIPLIGFFPTCKAIWDFCPYCGAKMDGGDKNAIS